MKYTIEDVTAYFRKLGWVRGHRSSSTSDDCYFTRFPGYPECGTNPGKGILVYADIYDYQKAPVRAAAVELHLVGQIGNEQWADLHIYSIDSLDHIPVCCERLLKAWKTMNEVHERSE